MLVMICPPPLGSTRPHELYLEAESPEDSGTLERLVKNFTVMGYGNNSITGRAQHVRLELQR